MYALLEENIKRRKRLGLPSKYELIESECPACLEVARVALDELERETRGESGVVHTSNDIS